jgi:hypothetical protein
MVELIKVLDIKIAKELSKKGFAFTLEDIGGTNVYSFIKTGELLSEISKNFSGNPSAFFIDNLMYFNRKGG